MSESADHIRTAVVPVAGRATRLRPLSTVVGKCFWPLAHPAGRVRPVLHWILADAAAGGIEQALLVVSPDQRAVVEAYLAAAGECGDADLPTVVECVEQPTPAGLGDAVLRARGLVGDAPVLLMLGDHVHRPAAGRPSCTAQVLEAFASRPATAMIGVQPAGEAELLRVGAVAGEPVGEDTYLARDFIEKPTPAQARARLRTPDLPEGMFLAHCGLYAFSPAIFDCLEDTAQRAADDACELELAAAQELLLRRCPDSYFLRRIRGESLDTGTPEAYVRAFERFRAAP